MFGPWKASLMMVGALLGLLLAGCGTNPYANDPYGTGYGSQYGGGYDSGYGGGYDSGSSYGGGYDSGSSYGSDYSGGSSYGSDYGSGGSSYGSDYGSDYGSSYGNDYGNSPTTGASPSPSTKPTAAPVADEQPVLTAWVTEVKETGVMGMGKVIAKVEVENPSNRTLTGRLRVLFTDNGKPTANGLSQKLTLKPFEKRQLTFTADAWRLDDAEASIETEEPKKGDSTVSDRK